MSAPQIVSFEEFERAAETIIRPPFVSRFGARDWSQMGTGGPSLAYQWLIKGVIPAHERILVFGESQTGKSYFNEDMVMHIARGVPFHGRRVKQAAVVYCAFEGGKGFENRILAYMKHHGLSNQDPIPFKLLTRRADLFGSDVDINDLLAEIKHWAADFEERYGLPLGVVVLDTYSAASPGAKEIASEDVSKVLTRIQRIVDECKCSVIIVHHKPKGGDTPRGHGSLYGDLETLIDVSWLEGVSDSAGRPVRRAKVVKQREGETGIEWNFTLPKIELGADEDGDPVTSCTVVPFSQVDKEQKAKGFNLTANQKSFFTGLIKVLETEGVVPPIGTRCPGNIQRVADYEAVRRSVWDSFSAEEEATPRLREKVKKICQRGREDLGSYRIIGTDVVDGKTYIWWTGHAVKGFAPIGLVGERYDRERDTDDSPF